MFKDTLYVLLSELSERHRSREDFFEHRVKTRLDESLLSYTQDIDTSIKYLSSKSSLNVMKREASMK